MTNPTKRYLIATLDETGSIDHECELYPAFPIGYEGVWVDEDLIKAYYEQHAPEELDDDEDLIAWEDLDSDERADYVETHKIDALLESQIIRERRPVTQDDAS